MSKFKCHTCNSEGFEQRPNGCTFCDGTEGGQPPGFSLDDDTPLVCNRDQSGDTTCESCQ